MKHVLMYGTLIALLMSLLIGCSKQSTDPASSSAADNGVILKSPAGIPYNGAHYNLNIIGVPKDKKASMNDNMGHRIFVALGNKDGEPERTKILLAEGDFQVLDANGTDGEAAFQLPDPDPENDGVTEYSVWARPLGKPGGKATMTTCGTDEEDVEWCSIYSYVAIRNKGKSTFTNVSKELLYIYADMDGDDNVERYPLFDEALEDYYWQYDNNGLKLLQLRFYPETTDVNE